MIRTHRMTKLTCVPLALTLLAATSCGAIQPGQALPDEAAVSHYISAKYNRIVAALSTNIIGKDGIQVREDFTVSLDEKKSDYTTTSTAVGSPLKRVDINQNNRDPHTHFSPSTPRTANEGI